MKAQANWKESCLEQLWFKLGLYFLNALEANLLSSEQGDRAAQGREEVPILTVIWVQWLSSAETHFWQWLQKHLQDLRLRSKESSRSPSILTFILFLMSWALTRKQAPQVQGLCLISYLMLCNICMTQQKQPYNVQRDWKTGWLVHHLLVSLLSMTTVHFFLQVRLLETETNAVHSSHTDEVG